MIQPDELQSDTRYDVRSAPFVSHTSHGKELMEDVSTFPAAAATVPLETCDMSQFQILSFSFKASLGPACLKQ